MPNPRLFLRSIPVLLLAASTAAASGGHNRTQSHSDGMNVEISTDDGRAVRRCSDIRVRFDGRDAERAEQQLTGAGPRGPMAVKLERNSGAWVRGSDRRDWSVLACKAADNAATLAQVSVSFDRGDLQTRGPENERWTVFYVIEAPRSAEIDAEASNGPLSFEDLSGRIAAQGLNGPIAFRACSGRVEARVTNGPISLDGVSGEVDVRAVNGPISIQGGSGNVQASTQNGPISVRLSGDSWKDGGLDARAVNGPVSLRIPDGYRSGTVVQSAGRSPVRCRAASCGNARKTWDDDDRRLEFGEGEAIVRLSTVNGPVTVDSTRGD